MAMEKLSRLDDLISRGAEDYRTLTMTVLKTLADDLSVHAKKLGVSRARLVREVFMDGLDKFRARFPDSMPSVDTVAILSGDNGEPSHELSED